MPSAAWSHLHAIEALPTVAKRPGTVCGSRPSSQSSTRPSPNSRPSSQSSSRHGRTRSAGGTPSTACGAAGYSAALGALFQECSGSEAWQTGGTGGEQSPWQGKDKLAAFELEDLICGGEGNPALLQIARQLQDDNRSLREELSKRRASETLGQIRRPLAAIAGGGFRGNSSPSTPSTPSRQCECEQLRAKVARLRQQLQEAKEDSRRGSKQPSRNEEESSQQRIVASVEAGSQTAKTAVRSESCQVELLLPPEELSQPSTRDADLQAEASPRQLVDDCTQTLQVEFADAACAAAPGQATVWTQTQARSKTLSTQKGVAAASVEATARVSTASVGSQAVTTAATKAASSQTLKTATQESSVQAAEVAEAAPPRPKVRASSVQTAPALGVPASTQTVEVKAPPKEPLPPPPPPKPKMEDRWTQIDDSSAAAREAEMKAKLTDAQAARARAEGQEVKLATELGSLRTQMKGSEERVKVWQQAVQSRAFKQLNVTILCPRAECTVRGETLTLDSWDPERLRREFEREVFPHFARVFVEDAEQALAVASGGRASGKENTEPKRSEAAEQAMAEFANVFRERLGAMLAAPSAQAAYDAAATTAKPSVPTPMGSAANSLLNNQRQRRF
eukprot:TRINITY_DN18553_c0_g1_i1.p1 TRINITY_DN18553_c0_g1~~TRINITY_DN18553_c0_g1_i1.p1  ORF type:complete len:622 (+),score=160.53 TRINITY_DN18553_c0_g1_i1:98-1963(+)